MIMDKKIKAIPPSDNLCPKCKDVYIFSDLFGFLLCNECFHLWAKILDKAYDEFVIGDK